MINEAIHLIRVSNLSLLRHEPGHKRGPAQHKPPAASAKPNLTAAQPDGPQAALLPVENGTLYFLSPFFLSESGGSIPYPAVQGWEPPAQPPNLSQPLQAPTDPAGVAKHLFQRREFTGSKNVAFFREGRLRAG